MFSRYEHIDITWSSEEERRYMKSYEWHERSPYLDSWYDYDAHFPPPKNDDYRNCDYFVFNGICYGVGTLVKLKDNQFFAKFRREFCGRFTELDKDKKENDGYYAVFDGGYMNGIMRFRQLQWYYPGTLLPKRYGNTEISAYVPEDYIERIIEPVVVSRHIGKVSVIGNYKNLGSRKQAQIQAELWPQVLFAGLFLLLCVFTNAKEFWVALVCVIVCFVVWFSFRANHW